MGGGNSQQGGSEMSPWAQGFATQLGQAWSIYGHNSPTNPTGLDINDALSRYIQNNPNIPGADWKFNSMWGGHPTGGNYLVSEGRNAPTDVK